MSLFELLEEKKTFTYNEQLIIDYILKNEEEFLNLSIYELAEKTNSSTSTIVRLCKKCDLFGFKDFKILFARELEIRYQRIKSVDVNTPFSASDSHVAISKKIAILTSDVVATTQRLLTDEKLVVATKAITNATNIYGVGVSDNYIRLRDFKTKLLRIGMYMRSIDLQAEQYQLAQTSTKKDAAIVLSYSGETAEIVNDTKIFARNNTPIIAVTGNKNSTLANYATVVFLLPSKESNEYKVSNFSSQISCEYILNVLYSCIFNENFENNFSNQKVTPISKFDF